MTRYGDGRGVACKRQRLPRRKPCAPERTERRDKRIAGRRRIRHNGHFYARDMLGAVFIYGNGAVPAERHDEIFHALFAEDLRHGAKVVLIRAVFVHADRVPGHGRGLVLVRGEKRGAPVKLRRYGRGGGGVYHDRHAGVVRPARHGLVDEHRQLKLQHDEIVIFHFVADPGNLLHGHRAVCAGADNNAVVRAGLGDLQRDGGNAGRVFGVHNDAGYVHAGGGRCRNGLAAVGVVADTAGHRNVRAQTRALHRLIGALSARRRPEIEADHGLSAVRRLFRGGDQVHDKDAYNKNTGFSVHRSGPPVFFFTSARSRRLRRAYGNSAYRGCTAPPEPRRDRRAA